MNSSGGLLRRGNEKPWNMGDRHKEGDLSAIAVPHPPGDVSRHRLCPHLSNESMKGLPASVTIFCRQVNFCVCQMGIKQGLVAHA